MFRVFLTRLLLTRHYNGNQTRIASVRLKVWSHTFVELSLTEDLASLNYFDTRFICVHLLLSFTIVCSGHTHKHTLDVCIRSHRSFWLITFRCNLQLFPDSEKSICYIKARTPRAVHHNANCRLIKSNL